MLWRCEFIPPKIALHHHNRNNSAIIPSSKCSVVYVIISESPETRLVHISIQAISMHTIESREISNRKYLSKTTTVSQSALINGPSGLAGEPAVPDEHLQVPTPLAPGTGPVHLPGPATVHRKQAHQQKSECDFIWPIYGVVYLLRACSSLELIAYVLFEQCMLEINNFTVMFTQPDLHIVFLVLQVRGMSSSPDSGADSPTLSDTSDPPAIPEFLIEGPVAWTTSHCSGCLACFNYDNWIMIINTNDTEYFYCVFFFVWFNTRITKKMLVFYDSVGGNMMKIILRQIIF